jgi:tRNA1Val (adenine37-N6)-methyltransferase
MEETLDTLSTGGIRILQPRKGYRYSIDALILPFFMKLRPRDAVIELGTGTGVISMVLAKRCPKCRIVSVELQKRLHGLLLRNLELNALAERVKGVHGDIRQIKELFDPGGFDQVCSNPPFRKTRSGRLNPDSEKAIARHEIALSLDDLSSAAAHLLKKQGRFSLIYLPERLVELIQRLRRCNLEPKRMQTIHSFPNSPPVLILMEAIKGGRTGLTMESPFNIYRDESRVYSEAMEAIYAFRS